MLFHKLQQIGRIFLTVEDFPFPVLDIFLKVISSRFRDAEIFHGIGNFNPHFLAYPEKMIYGITGCKNNCRIIQDIDPVFPEFFGLDPFNFYKFMEINTYIKFPGEFTIRGFFKFYRLWLGYEYIFYFQT
jgi:hypothetical protein